MGKVCWINGQPYSVGLPTGGENRDDRNNQWDEMIDFLGEGCNNIFHWRRAFSWCKEMKGEAQSVMRGRTLVRYWNYLTINASDTSLGFRPVLTPLSPNTLKPDLSLLEDIPDGQKIALASLYLDGKLANLSGKKGPDYKGEAEITLGDRDDARKNWLYVIKCKDLLWADRNILVNISWKDLKKQGFAD